MLGEMLLRPLLSTTAVYLRCALHCVESRHSLWKVFSLMMVEITYNTKNKNIDTEDVTQDGTRAYSVQGTGFNS